MSTSVLLSGKATGWSLRRGGGAGEDVEGRPSRALEKGGEGATTSLLEQEGSSAARAVGRGSRRHIRRGESPRRRPVQGTEGQKQTGR
jgi:hypothetical protein